MLVKIVVTALCLENKNDVCDKVRREVENSNAIITSSVVYLDRVFS